MMTINTCPIIIQHNLGTGHFNNKYIIINIVSGIALTTEQVIKLGANSRSTDYCSSDSKI
jgi:hypothetical protein